MIHMRVIACLSILATPGVAQTRSSQPSTRALQGASFVLQLPDGIESKDESPPMMDFQVFWVYSDTERLFGMYEGNAPDLGDDHPNGAGMEAVHLGQVEATMSRMKNPDGTFSGQYLVQTKQVSWPSQIHIWYTNQPEAKVKAITAILQTLQLNEPKH